MIVDPAAERIVALRKRLRLSRQKFADRAARVLLTVIDRDPEAVVRALAG